MDWVKTKVQPFPEKTGVLICWDGQKYIAFFYHADTTYTLPAGTTHWFLVPEPPTSEKK